MTPSVRLAILAPVADKRDASASTTVPGRSPGRPPVPRERIVATALKIVDEEGAEALSLRTLAQRLDSSTATLYRHFSNRADLISHVVDSIFGGVPSDTQQQLQAMGWEQACRFMARWMFDTLREHPNVAPLLVEQVPVGPNAMAQREAALGALLGAGFSPAIAVRCYSTIARYVLGFAIQLGGNPNDVDDPRLAAAYRGSDRTHFPATAAVADFVPVPLEDEFTFGLELLLSGLAKHRRTERREAKSAAPQR